MIIDVMLTSKTIAAKGNSGTAVVPIIIMEPLDEGSILSQECVEFLYVSLNSMGLLFN
jgi:hypothetical protein